MPQARTEPLQTHYDTLSVARDAPDEVIRAAYRALSQRHHPDRNPGDANAARLMQRLNDAYAVLSDPAKRREHDAWITRQAARRETFAAVYAAAVGVAEVEPARPVAPRRPRGLVLFTAACVLAMLVVLGYRLAQWLQPPPPAPRVVIDDGAWRINGNELPGPRKAAARGPSPTRKPGPASLPSPFAFDVQWSAAAPTSDAAKPDSVPLDPNGQPWPEAAGEVAGLRQDFLAGLPTVTVTNDEGDAPVFVKLVSLDSGEAVRHVYVPAHSRYTVRGVRAGAYALHFRNLQTGEARRSDPFSLREFETPQGTRYSELEITLYRVPGGALHDAPVAAGRF